MKKKALVREHPAYDCGVGVPVRSLVFRKLLHLSSDFHVGNVWRDMVSHTLNNNLTNTTDKAY